MPVRVGALQSQTIFTEQNQRVYVSVAMDVD